jgi:hypothetical protein
MTKRQEPSDGSTATRFKSGQSGNPKGRPRKPKPLSSSPFAILDELLTVHEPESVSELPLEDAMLIKTYQRAITGSPRAGKKLVKMILERRSSASRAARLDRAELPGRSKGTLRMRLKRSKSWALLQGRRVRTRVIAKTHICALSAGRLRRR